MSRTVETNVVEMQFDNSNFEKNVNQTVKSIDKLKDSLTLGSNTTSSLSNALSSIDVSKVVSGIETLSDRFSIMGIAGMTVIQRLTNAAIDLGLTLERKVVGVFGAAWNQIITGGTSRAANIEKATFQLKGIFGEEVEGQMKLQMAMTGTAEQIKNITGLTEDLIVAENAANYAVADTAFGLDSAAKAASVLATSGVDVVQFYDELADESGRARTEMQVALRAISGTASMANVSYDEMAHIFERVSGANRVMGDDLQSLSSRGLNALAVLADYMNEVGLTTNATQQDIKEMVSKGKIDFMTFAKAMDKAYGQHAKDANSTFSGAFDNMRFALSKIGADFIAPLRDDMIPILNNVRMAINAVRASLGPFTDAFKNTSHFLTDKLADKFKNLIGFGDTDSAWKESDQWKNAIDKITNIVSKATDILFNFWDLIDSIVHPISEARKEILPANGYSGITTFLDTVNNLIKKLTLSADSMEQVNRVARGFFSIFKIAGQIIRPVIAGITDLVKGLGGAETTFGETVASFGDFLVELANSNKVFDITTKAVEMLSNVSVVLIGVLKKGVSTISEFANTFISKIKQIRDILADRFDMPALTDINVNLDSIKSKLEPVKNYLEKFKDGIIFIGSKIVGVVKTIFGAVKGFVVKIFEEIKSIFTDIPSYKKYENAFDLSFFTVLIAGIAKFIKDMGVYYSPLEKIHDKIKYFFANNKETWDTLVNFISDGKRAILKLPDLVNNLRSVFGNLNDAIKNAANMNMFKAVALTLVAFTASVYILSKIDADKAIASIIAVGLIIQYLKNVMLEFNAFDANIGNIAGASKAVKALVTMSASVLILAFAISKITKAFDKNPTGAIFSLVAIYVVIEMMMKVMQKISDIAVEDILNKTPKIAKAFGLAMIGFGLSLKLIASAISTITKAFDRNWMGAAFALVSIYVVIEMMMRILVQFQKGALLNANNSRGIAKMGFAMLEIAAAVVLMAVAIRIIAKAFSGDSLVPGILALGTVVGLMIGVVVVIKQLSDACGKSLSGLMGMQVASTALVSFAISMAILGLTIAGLAKSFNTNTGATIAAVATIITMMISMAVILNNFKPSKAIANGFALIEVAIALSMIGRAIGGLAASISSNPMDGVTAMGMMLLMLLGMCVSLEKMNPAKAIVNAFAMLEFASALTLIAIAVRAIGSMGLKNAAVGVGAIIGIMAAFLGLAALVGIFAPISVGLLTITASITAMGAAMLMAGAGMALFGVGVMTIAAGITALAGALSIGLPMLVQGITATITAIAAMIPTIAAGLANGLLIFIEIILDHVDVLINLISTIVISVVQSLTTMIPQIADMLVTLLLAVLDLVANNIGPVTDKLISIFVNFLNAVSARLPEINAALTDFFTPILGYIVDIISGILSIIAEGIGEIFGSFIGSLINGIARSLDRESLVSFADTLAEFMLHLQPFIDGVKGLDESTARAALMLAAMITILTADDIIRSLSSWFTGGNSMAKLGEDLAAFGPYIKQYANDVKGIDVNAVEASTRAAQMIADFARTIPNEGGLLGRIFGENDIASFGAKLKEFGPFIRQYSDDVQGIDVEAVESSTNAAQMIADFARTIPNEGGLVSAITGDNDIETFGKQLKSFGKHIAKYAEEVDGLDSEAVESSVSAARMLTEFANTIPNSGGLKAIFEGDNAVDKFGEDLVAFGTSIEEYYGKIQHVDSDLMLNTTESLLQLLDILSIADGVSTSSVDNLQNLLGKVAEVGLEGFYDSLAVESVEDTYKAIEKFFTTLDDGFKENASTFADSASASGEEIGEKYAKGIKSEYSKSLVRAAAKELATESIVALGEAIGDDVISEDPASELNQVGINYDLGLTEGIELGEGSIIDAVASMADNAVNEADRQDEFYDTGYSNVSSYLRGANAASRSSNFIASFQSERDYLAYAAKQNQKPVSRQHEGYISPNYIYETEEEANAYQLAGTAARNYTRDTKEAGASTEELSSAYQSLAGSSSRATASTNSLSSATSGAGGSAKKAKTEIEKLIDKIDDLGDEYAKKWDKAKERANKDLFKGVDKQGDEFLDKVQDIMDEYSNIYTSAVERTNGQDLFAEVNDENESFAPETLLNNLEDQVNQVNELNTIISSLSGKITDNNLRQAISNMDVDDLPQLRAMYRMSSSQLADYEKMYQQKVAANQNKIQNELTGNLSQLTGKYTNVATYIAEDNTTANLLNNLQAQIDELNEYNSTIASLMSRITDMNLREAIAGMGIDSLDELKALNRMTDDQLDQYIAMYNSKITSEATSIEHEISASLSSILGAPIDATPFFDSYDGTMESIIAFLSGQGSAGQKAGQVVANQIGKGLSKGMTSEENRSAMNTSGGTLVNDLADGLTDPEQTEKVKKNALALVESVKSILSDASGVKESGGKMVQKICQGMEYARTSIEFRDCVWAIADTIKNCMDQKSALFQTIGANICSGIAIGIRSKSDLVSNAANSVVLRAISGVKRIAEIKSPSRVFMRIGKFMDEGLAVGLRENSGLAETEAEGMATNSISAVQEAINQLSGMLDGTIDVNPTITPTLDLSEVNAKSAALANMFNGRQVAVQAQADEQQTAMMNQLGNILAEQNAEPKSVVFNQTNNSPKALSTGEIYRQTRNGFSRLVSAVT